MNKKRKPMPPMKIDHEAIRNLATLLTETDLTEIEIAEGDKRIRVARSLSVQTVTAPTSLPQISTANVPDTEKPIDISPENHPGSLKSPMVGTIYLQAEASLPRFVAKGDTVKEGDTLLIIEAMKVMNPIKADRSGTITDILVEDSQPVEFGQALVIIE
ncbi:MAG: acetyl-CoA carboxylase biotin carboxyl carrier protein [Alphaproteobacteria bacterium]|nr:acetyl-CoA carboxylase biotin carboxyl carrier protein [Alphaproteobacteria bacterium]MCK5518261.1 acetyl-CoA carboxylase biotin carboxyl carrier protein [Alphaproteobacteria bacterium]